MKSRDLWKSALLILGAVGTVLPASWVTASEQAAVSSDAAAKAVATPQKTAKKPAIEIADITLGENGKLTGSILDEQGKPVAGSKIVVKTGRKTVAETTTTASGEFHFNGLRGGVYQIAHTNGVSVFRVWKSGTAPKNAKAKALIVARKQVIRAQNEVGAFGSIQTSTLISTGASLAAGTLGIVGISEASEANDEADAANAKLDALLATLN